MGKVDEVAHDHFFLRGTVAEMVEIIDRRQRKGRRTASSPRRSSATASTTAARSRSRSWNSSTAMASPCGAAMCAASTSIASICSGAWTVRRLPKNPFQEENRPRWGVRTSNPGGAASRSLVGSTPSLFRHVQKEFDETRAILSPCWAGHRNAKDLRRYPALTRVNVLCVADGSLACALISPLTGRGRLI